MTRGFLIGVVLWSLAAWAQAQSAPTYKCVTAGKIAYSDQPCVGAQIVDTTPTQGLDKISGTSKKGADVRNTETNKLMADGLKPLFNETPEQRSTRHRRSNLAASDKLECAGLDGQITGKRAIDAREEVTLYKARKRYKDLKC